MRLAFLGNFEPPQSTENHWRYAFEQLGVDFVPVQIDKTAAARWERIASGADAACLSTSWGWPLPCNEGTWLRLNRRGVKTFTVHLDLIMGIPREHEILGDRKHPQFFGPEHVWTSDGHHDEQWAALGVNHHWLPPAIHEPNAVLGTARPEWECDVVFTGSCRGYHPEWPRRKELVAAAEAKWGDRFRPVGGDWGNTVRGPELSDVYASAKVVLGDSLCMGFERDRYFSDRVPEVAGRGGLLVHPYNEASKDFLPCAVWTDWSVDEQIDVADWFVRGVDERAWSPAETRGYILGHHTYTIRAREILDTMGLYVGQAPPRD